MARRTAVRMKVIAAPSPTAIELKMYDIFSRSANPNPTEKPIWKPRFGESMNLEEIVSLLLY